MYNDNKTDVLGKVKGSFTSRKFRSGAYVTIMSAIVIVIVLVINMLISKMNIEIDLSTQNMYTLTKDTKDMIKDLEDDITIYYLVQTGAENDILTNIIKQYEANSQKVNVVHKDPILYPKFASTYVDDEVIEHSFIVVNNTKNRAKYVDYNDLLIQEINYQTYTQETTAIDVEGQLTAAIQYVTNPNLPKMYVLEGHGEMTTTETFRTTMAKMNVNMQTLSTLSQGNIPEDCDFLYINAPQGDLSDAETTMIKDYLASGGKAIITLDYYAQGLKNFQSILEYYGIEIVDGIVLEGDAGKHFSNYMNYIIPTVKSHEITSRAFSNAIPLFMPDSVGLKISETKRSSLSIEPLLTTSNFSFSRVNTSSTSIEKEEGDIDGPFNLGLVSTDTFNGVTSSIIVFSSSYTFGDETMSYSNPDLLTGTIGYMVGDTDLLSIPTKSLAVSTVSVSQRTVVMIGIAVIAVIPGIILLTGILVTLKRRKR